MVVRRCAVVLDLDGTLTPTHSPWQLVHEAFGIWDEARKYYDQFFAGEIDYKTWCERDTSLWEDRSSEEVREVLDGIQPVPEALWLLPRLAGARWEDGTPLPLMILSSGFDEIAYRILDEADVAHERVTVVANGIREESGKMKPVSRVMLRDPQKGKRAHLQAFVDSHGLHRADIIAADDREEPQLYENIGHMIHVKKPADLRRVWDVVKNGG